jgi:hypothetical protein
MSDFTHGSGLAASQAQPYNYSPNFLPPAPLVHARLSSSRPEHFLATTAFGMPSKKKAMLKRHKTPLKEKSTTLTEDEWKAHRHRA